jgi:hypothetical protein
VQEQIGILDIPQIGHKIHNARLKSSLVAETIELLESQNLKPVVMMMSRTTARNLVDSAHPFCNPTSDIDVFKGFTLYGVNAVVYAASIHETPKITMYVGKKACSAAEHQHQRICGICCEDVSLWNRHMLAGSRQQWFGFASVGLCFCPISCSFLWRHDALPKDCKYAVEHLMAEETPELADKQWI